MADPRTTPGAYTVSPGRVALSLLSGALAGGLAWTAVLLAPSTWPSDTDLPVALMQAAPVAKFAILFYGCGLALLGGPLWAIVHSSGGRGPRAAMALGGGLNAVVMSFLWPAYASTRDVWLGATAAAILIGIVVGLVIWRIAYRRAA